MLEDQLEIYFNDSGEYHVWQQEGFQRICILWSSIFEPVITLFNVNNPNISLAFPEMNGWKFYSYIKVHIPKIHLNFNTTQLKIIGVA